MDSDALFHVKQLFWQGNYKACIQESQSVPLTSLPPSSEPLSRALYASRSTLALRPLTSSSISSALEILAPALKGEDVPASVKAVEAFAGYLSAQLSDTEEDRSASLEQLRDLLLEYESADPASTDADVDEPVDEEEKIVRIMAASAFILEGEVEEAYATLTEGCGKRDLECTALLIQLLLSIDRKDKASQVYQAAKKFGDDALLVQVMEAWIGMKSGGRPLQQAYYLYEELYQLPSGRTPSILASHAAAHLLLGHTDEAKSDVLEALKTEQGRADEGVLAVAVTLGMDKALEQLTAASPSHPFVIELEAKSKAFDEAAAKFAIAA